MGCSSWCVARVEGKRLSGDRVLVCEAERFRSVPSLNCAVWIAAWSDMEEFEEVGIILGVPLQCCRVKLFVRVARDFLIVPDY